LKVLYEHWHFFPRSEVIVLPNPSPDFPLVDRLPPERQKVRLLFVGQLESHKGVRFLVESLKRMPEVELTIAGEGTLTDWVTKHCEENKRLNFLGFICADHLQACLGTVDAVVVPSLCYENSPTVIYESLSAGVPVLASDIGGVGELVRDGINGYLFKAGDAHALAHAIWRLREHRVAFMANQTEISATVAPFGLKNYTEELLRQLERVIARKRKS
jgi:glycosyltransferase involved in cell wall biosynthesis